MSGGVAYVYDEDGQFGKRCNTAMVALEKIRRREEQEALSAPATWHRGQTDEALLRKLIEDHHRWTGSLRARDILDHWADSLAKFVKVIPHEYQRALNERGAAKEAELAIEKVRAVDVKGEGAARAKARAKGIPAK
jgi:glutamate synthase domain-containing protein 3